MNYLMSYRIEQSIPLLVNTSYTITEIALQVGFSGASYYTEIFHRIMGITPKRLSLPDPWRSSRLILLERFYIQKEHVF